MSKDHGSSVVEKSFTLNPNKRKGTTTGISSKVVVSKNSKKEPKRYSGKGKLAHKEKCLTGHNKAGADPKESSPCNEGPKGQIDKGELGRFPIAAPIRGVQRQTQDLFVSILRLFLA